jgi:hypothetical protein
MIKGVWQSLQPPKNTKCFPRSAEPFVSAAGLLVCAVTSPARLIVAIPTAVMIPARSQVRFAEDLAELTSLSSVSS